MLTELKNKIGRLISLYEKAESEKQSAIQEKAKLAAIIEEKNTKIKELEKHIEQLQLANAFRVASVDRQEAKQKIGRIVREIDDCIAMLNN
jgi:chromosome segregation ATPase